MYLLPTEGTMLWGYLYVKYLILSRQSSLVLFWLYFFWKIIAQFIQIGKWTMTNTSISKASQKHRNKTTEKIPFRTLLQI